MRAVANVVYWLAILGISCLCIMLPMASFIQLAFQKYDRSVASYGFEPIRSSELTVVLLGPDVAQMQKLAWFASLSAFTSMVLAILLLLVLAPHRGRFGLATLVGLLTAGFFVPIIVKAYSFATLVPASNFMAILFSGGTFMVLFLAPSLAKIQSAPLATTDASYEYFTIPQRTKYLLRTSVGAIFIGFLCCFSMVFYSGTELRQLTTNFTPISDVFSSMLGNRDRELGMIAAFLLLLSISFSLLSTLVAARLWPQRNS